MLAPFLPATASDAEIIRYVDYWVDLLSQRKFVEAMALIPGTDSTWDAGLLAEVIAAYGDEENNQVTSSNNGTARDGAGHLHPAQQRKEVDWHGERGYVWYDLNLNGLVSDLTATFTFMKTETQLLLTLDDVHVM